jgi:triphosphatase
MHASGEAQLLKATPAASPSSVTQEAVRAANPLTFALHEDMTSVEAITSIGLTCIEGLFDNLALLDETGDIEVLHQARICVRRLRAALTLFRPVLGWNDRKAIWLELKWLSDLLGEAREFDIFIEVALAPAAVANPDAPGIAMLRDDFGSLRDQAYASIKRSLQEHRLSELKVDLAARLQMLPAADAPNHKTERQGQKTVGRYVEKRLQRRLKSLLNDSRRIEHLPPEEQHRLRIRAKKLRYMLEPVADLLPRKRIGSILKSLRALQDALGQLNDCNVNRRLALKYANKMLAGRAEERATLFAAGLVAAECARNSATALSEASAARDRLVRLPALRFR